VSQEILMAFSSGFRPWSAVTNSALRDLVADEVTSHNYTIESTALDVNRNDQNDFSGTDRITQTLRDVVSNYGTNVIRTQTYVWGTDNANVSLLVSPVETSKDGRPCSGHPGQSALPFLTANAETIRSSEHVTAIRVNPYF
jgi:hypothetical protein